MQEQNHSISVSIVPPGGWGGGAKLLLPQTCIVSAEEGSARPRDTMGVYFASTGTAPLPKHAQLGVDGFELFFVFLRISFLEGAPLRGRLQSCHMKSAGGGVASVGRLTCLCTSEEGGVARRGEGSPREGRSGSNERQVVNCQALNPTSRTTINLPHCRSLRQRLCNVGLAARVIFFRENMS